MISFKCKQAFTIVLFGNIEYDALIALRSNSDLEIRILFYTRFPLGIVHNSLKVFYICECHLVRENFISTIILVVEEHPPALLQNIPVDLFFQRLFFTFFGIPTVNQVVKWDLGDEFAKAFLSVVLDEVYVLGAVRGNNEFTAGCSTPFHFCNDQVVPRFKLPIEVEIPRQTSTSAAYISRNTVTIIQLKDLNPSIGVLIHMGIFRWEQSVVFLV